MPVIEARLCSVERQLRRQRMFTALLLVALLAVLGLGAARGVPDEVRARKFAVINEKGQEVARLMSNTPLGGPGDGHLQLLSTEGNDLVYAGADAAGDGLLTVGTRKGQDLIYAGATETSDGLIRIMTRKGEQLVYAGANKHRHGTVIVSNKIGQQRVYVGTNIKQDGIVRVDDRKGRPGVHMVGNMLGGGGAMTVWNKVGRPAVLLYADESAEGYVGAFDTEGKGRTLRPE